MLSTHRSPAMSTLLDIKSSVLRQVQVCPSFRRRTEEEPGSTSADPQEPPTGAWWVPTAPPHTVILTGPHTPAAPAQAPRRAQEGPNPRPGGALCPSYYTPAVQRPGRPPLVVWAGCWSRAGAGACCEP